MSELEYFGRAVSVAVWPGGLALWAVAVIILGLIVAVSLWQPNRHPLARAQRAQPYRPSQGPITYDDPEDMT
jgi:hypothetical protein